MSTSQLELYNGALDHLGQRRILSLTDESDEGQARRSLDGVWNSGKFKDRVLGMGLWNFAIRTLALTYSPSVDVPFGYSYAFDKQSDWIRTAAVSSDPMFNTLLDYEDSSEYWFAHPDTIYVKYVSNDAAFGYDLSLWPESFTAFVEAYLAWRVAMPITNDTGLRDHLWGLQKKLGSEARAIDGANEAVAYPPSGSWVRSRFGQSTAGRNFSRRGW